MKKILSLSLLVASASFAFNSGVDARDLTYRLGVGYQQMSYSSRGKSASDSTLGQTNGLVATYGIAPDMQAGVWFGFSDNFGNAALGPTFRYDIHRLFNRDAVVWNYLNLFVQAAFLAKMGGDVKKGVAIHAPTIGFEILPFERNNFSISTNAGLIIDFIDKNKINFTQGQLGDVSVKYYF